MYDAPPKSCVSVCRPKTASRNVAAPSVSGVTSVFQARLTGSLTSSAPLWPRASQPPNMPPAGWAKNAIRPASETSIGSISAPPPASATRVASASTLSVAK